MLRLAGSRCDRCQADRGGQFEVRTGRVLPGRLYNLSGGLYQSRVREHDLAGKTFYYYEDPAENERLGRVANQGWSVSTPPDATSSSTTDPLTAERRRAFAQEPGSTSPTAGSIASRRSGLRLVACATATHFAA